MIVKLMYNVMKTEAHNGISYANKNWALRIKKILEQLGFAYLWLNQDIMDINFQSLKFRTLDTIKRRGFQE